LKPIQSSDGSFTLYSERFQEHYHSIKDGALNESLHKHIIPALSLIEKEHINILDISFGLGFNSLTTIYRLLNSNSKLTIHSPEIDSDLVKSIKDFPYPDEFQPLIDIINSIAEKGFYESQDFKIYVHIEDARHFLDNWSGEKFDIVYQDAFSPKRTPLLWTVEYFQSIKRVVNREAILTTYSSSTPVRMGLYDNGFNIYSYENEIVRNGTIASLSKLTNLIEIDMERKKLVSSNASPLRDIDFRSES
jgi:tRNA U34 5-methylaminomethyl-2-thiouridine-forming methyltransferase MnmC